MDNIDFLVEKYKPYCYLHPFEKYFPCTIEFYCQHSYLSIVPWNEKIKLVLDVGQVLPETLIHYNNPKYHINVIPEAYTGQGTHSSILKQIPFYCHVNDLGICYDFQYIFFYCYTPKHIFDVKHITVRVHALTNEILSVYFQTHENQGQRIFKKKLYLKDTSHVCVYISKESHGNYWSPAFYPGIFCCLSGNHYTDYKGLQWYPEIKSVLLHETLWYSWNGFLGTQKMPLYKSWYALDPY